MTGTERPADELCRALDALQDQCRRAREAVAAGQVPVGDLGQIAAAGDQVARDARRLLAARSEDYEEAVAAAIGRHLAQARRARGWSQADLATRLPGAVGRRTVAGYERGTAKYGVGRLVTICRLLDTSPLWVLARALDDPFMVATQAVPAGGESV